ncbi:glycoside hydrolase family 5 protein [Marinimicrobium sp. ABcell2]|uniref:glycoside hydrolase family 5 protein n=1 Tax=Marinimicrobium sp. ABcell2 TaxID=3069751 RepID=UPI0027B073AC|nr:glycoside hydrolase family 5 protein [Marinimicrobium sp. ABcell2]MDQ2076221.1 glycoside hydrolase family 5 protein [Marinimicrobium sp. ABcell2]
MAPVTTYGFLSVDGNQIVDMHGEPVALAGPSLFWSNNNWGGERFYNSGVVHEVAWNWNASLIRAAMGVEASGGYLEDKESNLARVETVIDAAIKEGLYVIVDWHSHRAEEHPEEAVEFFTHIAREYGEFPNIIYEIYNEPLEDTDWSETIKPYAEEVIRAIRAIDPQNLIVVGTPSWSQDVDVAAQDPIVGFENIVYALHFYAGSHGQELRDKAQEALDQGLALMVTEWGTVNADGDGQIAAEETSLWLEFMRENNLSHANWALNDKEEGASMFYPGVDTDGGWSDDDFTASGEFVRSILLEWHAVE